MSRGATRVLCALPLVLLLNAAGCQFESVPIELPGFFSTGIDELWFWRRDEVSGDYVRAGHMELVEITGPVGSQMLRYKLYSPQGDPGLTIGSPVSVTGDAVRVVLWFANWMDDGTFKVSARNASGESALSSASVTL